MFDKISEPELARLEDIMWPLRLGSEGERNKIKKRQKKINLEQEELVTVRRDVKIR